MSEKLGGSELGGDERSPYDPSRYRSCFSFPLFSCSQTQGILQGAMKGGVSDMVGERSRSRPGMLLCNTRPAFGHYLSWRTDEYFIVEHKGCMAIALARTSGSTASARV